MTNPDGKDAESANLGLLGLNRKAMESQRLARIAARKRPADETEPDGRPAKAAKSEAATTDSHLIDLTDQPITPPPLRNSKTGSRNPQQAPAPPTAKTADKTTNGSAAQLKYPDGIIKKTWCFKNDRQNDIKIEEVLDKRNLKIAVLSSWQIDMEWLSSKLDLQNTKLMLVMQSKHDEDKTQWQEEAKSWGKSLRLCFPPMPKGTWTMHSKLMLLFYDDFLRIVVPSANLTAFDWGESGHLENTVFLVDLPRLADEVQGASNSTTIPFTESLLYFLKAQEVPEDVIDGVKKFDFSKTSHLAFVHNIVGSHQGEGKVLATGFPLFSQSVKQLGADMKLDTPLQVDFAASSVGQLTANHINEWSDAARGHFKLPDGKKQTKAPSPSPSLRIHFPSVDTVHSSRHGAAGAGTIFFTAANWKRQTFPKSAMRDLQSKRDGVLSHTKMLVLRTPTHALVYAGSANASPSAWGSLSWDRTHKAPQLWCGNWECGVLMRVAGPEDDGTRAVTLDGDGVLPLTVFEGKAEIPFKIPGIPYVDEKTQEVKRPWIPEGHVQVQ